MEKQASKMTQIVCTARVISLSASFING